MSYAKPLTFVGLWLAFEAFDFALMFMGLAMVPSTVANTLGAAALTHFIWSA